MSNSKVAAITSAIQSLLAALVLLGVVTLTAEQLGGIITAVSAALAVVVVWRGSDSTPGTVQPENRL